MEHHALHQDSIFEGYYNKFYLPSGAHLILIICKVKGAKEKPNLVSFTYVPSDVSNMYQREVFPNEMEMKTLDEKHSFILDVPGMGFARWNADETCDYEMKNEFFNFRARTTARVPWSSEVNTPEGLLVKLPLPLHWHVHSLASDCDFTLSIPNYDLPRVDESGKAKVHQEKNYASSFPSAHMWVQARKSDSGICCAGGRILGLDAFLLGYRSKDLNVDFRPPFAVRFQGLSPFMSYVTNWETRSFSLSVQSFRRKITLEAQAPKGTFFSLSAPFAEGHRENYLGQSSQATITVKVYESGWFSPWTLVREETFNQGSLEFGAGYYPPASSEKKIN